MAANTREDKLFAGIVIKDDDVEGLGEKKEIGRGCYGAVYDVQVYGVRCIAKRQHDILVGRGKEERLDPEQRAAAINCFRKECILLCSFRHPNVVQVMGVHCGSDEADISLIMEHMHMDLKHCMDTYPHIPLPYKTSILRDVAYGLAYLHSHNIIHRDLNAGNVLLTEFLRAKIADLGVARLFDREIVLQHTKTRAPGAPDFMPPEATVESPKYDCKLDIFSFGHLAVYLVNQRAPVVADRLVTADDLKKKQMQVGKRREALDQMSYQLGGSRHPLYSTVVQCLSDTPDQRPTSRDLVKRIEEICRKFPLMYENSLELLAKLQKQENDLKIQENDMKIQENDLKVLHKKMHKFAQSQSDSDQAANAKQKENDVLKEKLALAEIEARTYKEDFEQMKKDREIAFEKLARCAEKKELDQQLVSKRPKRRQLQKKLLACREELEDEKRKRHERDKDLNEVITRLKLVNQTLESHLEEKTKLYDDLRQQYYKVLEQTLQVEQVQSMEEKMTDAAGKTEDETEEENVQADECTIKVGKEEMEEDITNGILLVEDWEKGKKEEEKSMRKLVRKSHTLGGRHNQSSSANPPPIKPKKLLSRPSSALPDYEMSRTLQAVLSPTVLRRETLPMHSGQIPIPKPRSRNRSTPEELGVYTLSTSQSAALSNGLAEESSPHRLRRIKTMDMPTGLQHQPVGVMTELTQKLARKRL